MADFAVPTAWLRLEAVRGIAPGAAIRSGAEDNEGPEAMTSDDRLLRSRSGPALFSHGADWTTTSAAYVTIIDQAPVRIMPNNDGVLGLIRLEASANTASVQVTINAVVKTATTAGAGAAELLTLGPWTAADVGSAVTRTVIVELRINVAGTATLHEITLVHDALEEADL